MGVLLCTNPVVLPPPPRALLGVLTVAPGCVQLGSKLARWWVPQLWARPRKKVTTPVMCTHSLPSTIGIGKAPMLRTAVLCRARANACVWVCVWVRAGCRAVAAPPAGDCWSGSSRPPADGETEVGRPAAEVDRAVDRDLGLNDLEAGVATVLLQRVEDRGEPVAVLGLRHVL